MSNVASSGQCLIPSLDGVSVRWTLIVVCPQCGADASVGPIIHTETSAICCQACKFRRDLPMSSEQVHAAIFKRLAEASVPA